jgi:hypothetical protein
MPTKKDDDEETGPVVQPAVTGRPADVPSDNSTFGDRAKGAKAVPMRDPEDTNSTFAERVTQARESERRIVSRKQVKVAENKAVEGDESK